METMKELINELNESIFKKIREELMKGEKTQTTVANIAPKKDESNRGSLTIAEISGENKRDADILKSAQIEITDGKPIIQNGGNTPVASSRADILSKVENPNLIEKAARIPTQNTTSSEIDTKNIQSSIAAQKLSGSFQIPTVKTEYSLNNISKQNTPVGPTSTAVPVPPVKPKVDPYREIPE